MSEQAAPPKVTCTIPVVKKDLDAIVKYQKEQRVVAGLGVTITDAPGGGKIINSGFARAIPSLWFFNGAVRTLKVGVTT